MVALMYAGMMALHPLYSWAARLLGSTDAATDWPIVSAIVMTVEMTVPMIPFMRWHGHSRRHIAEMAGAMASPCLLAAFVYTAGVVSAEAVAGIGHAAMVPAMVVAMLCRRGDYSGWS
jgi:flagellar biosynthetic protein FliP